MLCCVVLCDIITYPIVYNMVVFNTVCFNVNVFVFFVSSLPSPSIFGENKKEQIIFLSFLGFVTAMSSTTGIR